jgi:hypothetical protein
MATLDNKDQVVSKGAAVMLSQRPNDRPVPVPRSRPGIVIFLHGVNDPGVTYKPVEEGLCSGLNERLSRDDLIAGCYGEDYIKAKKERDELGKLDADILYDPDTYEYMRAEKRGKTHSIFIPFYWGYRAANNEIAKRGDSGKVVGVDTKGPYIVTRGQYQDKAGNRLDAHFAKEGGYFANATSSIPEMYGAGFKTGKLERTITRTGLAGPYTYIGDAPERHYFVLAAHRLAMLISTIRGEQVQGGIKQGDVDAANETITIMAHSQGTLITLLAQALLRQDGYRCADCVIMVDTPYSVRETSGSNQSALAKLRTLVDIVNEVTKKPFTIPALADLMITSERSGGRAGADWTPAQGKRKDKKGNWITFDERDNRGKVYLYFCPEDTVVGLDSVQGIGTFGVPDKLLLSGHEKIDAMDQLKDMRFYQRMWTRLERGFGRESHPVLVGMKPGHIAVRDQLQRLTVGPDAGMGLVMSAATTTSHSRNEMRNINGEQLNPPHAPEMYGGEIVRGGSSPGHADRAGQFSPDDVSKDVALGNQFASLKWIVVDRTFAPPDIEAYKRKFNSTPDINDHSDNWRVLGTMEPYIVEREETPNEARKRMATDEKMRSDNSYHSAVLASAENHRWVTAMDVAIGQGATLDDDYWRDLLIRMADWRLTPAKYGALTNNKNYRRLSEKATALIEATANYYQNGVFPSRSIVPVTPPALVVDGRKV